MTLDSLTTLEQPLDDQIMTLIAAAGGSPHADLIKEIVHTALKLVSDRAGRGDLKLLNSALKELRYAFKVFNPYRHLRKVSIFGSSRTRPDQAEYQQAHRFAEAIARLGFMVITGAGDGIMAAGHGGAGREKSFGVNIRLPFEQRANAFIQDDPKLVTFKYFFTRKLVFMKESHAIVLFPGGFGTHDEGFEAMTLIQTGKANLLPLVFVDAPGGTYWAEWRSYVERHLLGKGMISEQDMSLFRVTSSMEDAVEEITRFYRVYHSARYVRDQLSIRLVRRPSAAVLARIENGFVDIVAPGGTWRLSEPLPEEANEPELAGLPRLVGRFNRRDFGRLRQLVDVLNADPAPSPGPVAAVPVPDTPFLYAPVAESNRQRD
jgi:uncharacterized protein (TIGR00730 family)